MVSPVGQKVVVEIIEQLDQKQKEVFERSGILLSDGIKQGAPDRGRVYAISSDIKNCECKIGDLVVFNKQDIFQGFRWDDKDLVSVEYGEILAGIRE